MDLLARALCKLYETRSNFNLKLLLTSRPYGGIRRGFQSLEIPGLPVIHLSGESDIIIIIIEFWTLSVLPGMASHVADLFICEIGGNLPIHLRRTKTP